jgi:hypothetical protein
MKAERSAHDRHSWRGFIRFGDSRQKATLRTHAATLNGRYGGAVAENTSSSAPSKFRRSFPAFGSHGLRRRTVRSRCHRRHDRLPTRILFAHLRSPIWLHRGLSMGFRTYPSRIRTTTPLTASWLSTRPRASSRSVTLSRLPPIRSLAASYRLSAPSTASSSRSAIRSTVRSSVTLIADENAPFVVSSAVSGVLAELLQQRDIVDYTARALASCR